MKMRNLPQFSNKYQIVHETLNDTKHKTGIMLLRNIPQFSNKYLIVRKSPNDTKHNIYYHSKVPECWIVVFTAVFRTH